MTNKHKHAIQITMKTIIEVLGRVKKESAEGKDYTLTTVILSDGLEVTTTLDVKVGDKVQAWYDPKYDMIKLKYEKN